MKASDWIPYLLFFFFGCLVSYILCQYQYLTIDTDVNVSETLVAFISILIGLYIAVILQQRYSKSQNLYNYLISRLDTLWTEFNAFSNQVEIVDQIEFTRVTKVITNLQRKILEFNKLLVDTGASNNNLESLFENLSKIFDSAMKQQGIVYYDPQKVQLADVNKKITDTFIAIYRSINKS